MIGKHARTDKQAWSDWEQYRKNIRNSLSVNLNETPGEKKQRIKDLEDDPQAWKAYYFHNFHKSETPAFHRRASRRMINNFLKKKRWSECRNWARGLSKSTLTMMDILYLVIAKKALKNIILTSSTETAADEFLEKYRAQLDTNPRLIHDYGKQEMEGSWTKGNFTTRRGVKFMAIGAGQSPRGTANDEFRPDCIIVDDFDTDEECLNPDIINKKWNWYERALVFTVDISEPYLIIWLGNIIDPDCCIVRASKKVQYTEVINIRDSKGKSVWPEKNSEEVIDAILAEVSWASGQQELFNNPVREGTVFKEMIYGRVPSWSKFKFLVVYADPATSPKDRATTKTQASHKSIVLIGYYNGKYYIIKCFVEQTSNSKFIDWFYAMRDYIPPGIPTYYYIENNTLQDPFYQEVFIPMFHAKGRSNGGTIGIIPDNRKKGDKFIRIEATLEPINRLGQLILNQAEEKNPHMIRLKDQFKGVSPTAKVMDAPDCVEGGVQMTKIKNNLLLSGGVEAVPTTRDTKNRL